MAKRLQVVLRDTEYREIQSAARARHMSIAEWVRHALGLGLRRERSTPMWKKLEAVREAARHNFPTGHGIDIGRNRRRLPRRFRIVICEFFHLCGVWRLRAILKQWAYLPSG